MGSTTDQDVEVVVGRGPGERPSGRSATSHAAACRKKGRNFADRRSASGSRRAACR